LSDQCLVPSSCLKHESFGSFIFPSMWQWICRYDFLGSVNLICSFGQN
jgi:hypothetical protein